MASVMDEYAAFRANLTTQVDNVLLNEVAETLVEHIQASVQENVYDAYDAVRDTSGYIRREEGQVNGTYGLKAPESYDRYTQQIDEDNTQLTIENITVGNPNYSPLDAGRIGDIIESGQGYNWTHSTIYRTEMPRPFMEPALESAMQDGSVEAAFESGLKKRGL